MLGRNYGLMIDKMECKDQIGFMK